MSSSCFYPEETEKSLIKCGELGFKNVEIFVNTYSELIEPMRNEFKIIKNMSDIKSLLDNRFKYTHKACIVNTDKVEAYDWKNSKIIFDNRKEVYMLSRTHKKELIG